jgi:membrane fusion protein, multidrug efflux system
MENTTRLAPLALVVLSACAARSPHSSAPVPAPRRVQVAQADRAHRPQVTEVVGTVRATRSATIAPLLGGTVAEIRVGLGSSVRAGDVLVRLSASDVAARLEQTRVTSAQAERDRNRATFLREQGAISVAQFEATMSQWSVARARQAEASSIAERTVLRAPFAGVITSKVANVGDTALPGQPLLVLEMPSALRFEAQVPERAGEGLAVGDRLPVRLEGLDRDLEGRIAEIRPASDDATRTRLFKIDLPETPGLRPGRFGRALVAGGQAIAVIVPSEAVVRRGQLETVYVVESGVAHLRLVRSVREREGRVEISSGLSGGETVVLAQAAQLIDGQRVEEVR